MPTISPERFRELWDELRRVGRATPADPEAFARLGLAIMDAQVDLTSVPEGDVISDILLHSRSQAVQAAFLWALETRARR
jgi:hypothetical protein